MPGNELLHTPPLVALNSGVVADGQTVNVPTTGPTVRNGFTVTMAVAIHPVGNVYVMVDVPVNGPPVTTPVLLTDAITNILLLHVPPPASVNAVVSPTHTLSVPVIADGNGLTVTTDVVLQPVGSA